MAGTLLIIRRELESRRAVFVAAAFAGLLALAAPLLPWVAADAAADARLAVAIVFAAAFAGGTAIVHGATMVATDLRERRLGFYFARPLSGSAIWAGKLLAGLILALGSGLVAVLPASLLSRDQVAGWLEPDAGTLIVGGALLLMGVAHLVAVVIASRSRLVAVDLVALVIIAGCVTLSVRQLLTTDAYRVIELSSGAVLVAAFLLILAAGWAQVVTGRCDPVRGHRVQSTVLWGGLGLTAVLLGAFAAFLVSATPASIREVEHLLAAGDGSWIAVQGPARWRGDYRPAFLVDTASRRFLRLPSWGRWWLPVGISADGRRAIWLEADALTRRSPAEFIAADLMDPRPRPRPTRIFVDIGSPWTWALSRDGTRIALGQLGQLTVYDLEGGRQVATTLLEGAKILPRPLFIDVNHLRVELWRELEPAPDRGRRELTIGAFDTVSGRFEVTARVELDLTSTRSRPLDPSAQRMVLFHKSGDGAEAVLHDAWTAAPIATLCSSAEPEIRRILFLADGRIAVDGSEAGTARLRVFDRDGRPIAERDLGPGNDVIPESEVAPGRVLVLIWSTDRRELANRGSQHGAVVDLDSGSVRPLGIDWIPALAFPWPWWRGRPPLPGSLASRLLVNPDGGLEVFDPATNTTRHLLGPS